MENKLENTNMESICDNPLKKYHEYMVNDYNKREGNLHLEDGYDCPLCKNKGYIAKAEKTEFGYWHRIDYECKCMKKRKCIRNMNRSGLKNIIGRHKFENYEAKEQWQVDIKEKAQKFVNARIENNAADDWFFIAGQSGAGKTHICTAICREFLLHGFYVKYMPWRDDSTKLKMSINDFENYGKLIGEMKNADVLYIDDFFKCGNRKDDIQKPTAADINLAFEIINYRYNNPQLITIISSETMIDDLMNIDEAIAGRVLERAKKYCFGVLGEEKNQRKVSQDALF